MTSYPVQIWEGYNYTGSNASLNYGQYANVNLIGIPNDSLSSIKVAAFTSVTLYDNANFGGDRIVIVGPKEVPSLSNYTGGMNDRTTSIDVVFLEPSGDTKANCCTGAGGGLECGPYANESNECNFRAMPGYCANNMADPRCQSWCRAHPVQCNQMALVFCASAEGQSSPFCSCINSPANAKNIINPKCIDKSCLDSGYLTPNMRDTACPSIIDCSVKATLNNSGIILSNNIPVQQNCGQGGPSSGGNIGAVIESTPVTTTPNVAVNGGAIDGGAIVDAVTGAIVSRASAFFTANQTMILIAFGFFLVVAMFSYFFLGSSPPAKARSTNVGSRPMRSATQKKTLPRPVSPRREDRSDRVFLMTDV